MPKFTIKGYSTLYKGKYLTVQQTEFLDKKGATKHWEWVERKNAVFIFPITRDGKAVLIKNYRVPLEAYVIEMPAGLIDKEGESELETAERELLEETGYRAKNFIPIRERPANSGNARNLFYTYIATDLEKIHHNVEGEDTEDLEVIEVPLDQLFEFYKNLPHDTHFSIDILAVASIVHHYNVL